MPSVQTQTLDAAGPIFSFILGGIAPDPVLAYGIRMGYLTLQSAFWKARNYGLPALKSLVRAHLARNLRATARGSQVWAPRVASFLI